MERHNQEYIEILYIPLILEHFLYTPEFIENLAELLEKAYEGVED